MEEDLDACQPSEWQRAVPDWMSGVITPLKWDRWEKALKQHLDQQFREYITSGIQEGFRIGFDDKRECKLVTKNMRSARQNPEVVTDYLLTECTAGRAIRVAHVFPRLSPIWDNFQRHNKEVVSDSGHIVPDHE